MAKRLEKKRREFDQKMIDLARVTRVVAGGRRFRFRAAVVIGNRKGRVGLGLAKGADVSAAVEKAVHRAEKRLFDIIIRGGTITHEVASKFKGAYVLLKPAPRGSGIIAGGPVRAVVELAGVKDILSKMLGSSNKISNAMATLQALKSLETPEDVAKRRGKTLSLQKVPFSSDKMPREGKSKIWAKEKKS